MNNFTLRYLGHSAFFIQTPNAGILIDPFISQNPVANFDYTKEKITHIFVTHGHSDHLGDAIIISKNTGAQLITVFELALYCQQRGANALPVGLGATLNFDFGNAIFLPAFHSSSTPTGEYAGCASSVLLDIAGFKIYHAGDTSLTQEFKMIKDVFAPNMALLPIGGTFTMDIEQASIASKWLGAKYIIPMHYNTFDAICADVNKFKIMVDNEEQKCIVMNANDQIEL